MREILTNSKNTYGFRYHDGEVACSGEPRYFPEFAQKVVDDALQYGECMVSGLPGAGKSHLVTDIEAVTAAQSIPTLVVQAHISGGAKRGAGNARYALGMFSEVHGPEGLIMIDNVDYFGYSGAQRSRRKRIAAAHIPVAELLSDIVQDRNGPAVCGLAHTQEWRDTHWHYDRDADEQSITQAAQDLLDSFDHTFTFDGVISEEIARQMLMDSSDEDIAAHEAERVIAQIKKERGHVLFRHINHVSGLIFQSVSNDLARIDQETESYLAGTSRLAEHTL